MEHGIRINGHLINNLRFADDTAIIADGLEGLQQLLNRIDRVGETLGFKINIKKTKVMAVTRRTNPAPDILIQILYLKYKE